MEDTTISLTVDRTSAVAATMATQGHYGALVTTAVQGTAMAYHNTQSTEKPGTTGAGLLSSVAREVVTYVVTPAPARQTTVSDIETSTVMHTATPPESTMSMFPNDGMEGGSFQAILGGVIVAMLLVCALVVYYTCRHRGSYITKEEEDDDEEESMGSYSSFPKERDISDED